MTLGDLGGKPLLLFIGAHCDDIEIGCGATMIRLAREYPAARIAWAVFSGDGVRERESRNAARNLLGDRAVELRFHRLRESHFPSQYDAAKTCMESLKEFGPSVIFTHRLEDRHQDHRLLAELSWNTFRSHLVLEYEIPKYEGDLGAPNFFVEASRGDVDHKVKALMSSFPSQTARRWFTEDTFRALLRIRGIESAATSGLAEAFHARKILF